jgi:GTP-binding protein
VVEADANLFVLADIPGLIEGAAEGAGLGTRFLGHIERCRVLLHLVDGTQEDVGAAYRTVRAELSAYAGGLEGKPEVLALNKIDALSPAEAEDRRQALAAEAGKDVLVTSGVSHAGIEAVLRGLWAEIAAARAAEGEAGGEPAFSP